MAKIPIITDQDDQDWHKRKTGKIKKELKKFMTKRELIGKKGKDPVSIPIPYLDIPTHRYGKGGGGAGVGQGEGEKGDPLAPGDPQQGEGAGEMPGEHILEVDIPLKELTKLLREELELPDLKPKGKRVLTQKKEKYNTIALEGPEGLRHHKRTYKEALKRQLASGKYDYENPVIVPEKRDKRFKSWQVVFEPEAAALIIFMMDVSGSMGEEQKEIVRITAFWLETFIKEDYKEVEIRYIIHDAVARQVDRDTFFYTRESGGTKISSAYNEAALMIDPKRGSIIGTKRTAYSPEEWNIYAFHFSDGDNWAGGDTEICMKLLEKILLPKVNLFGYFQVESYYGSKKFKEELDSHFKDKEKYANLKTTHMKDEEAIFESLREILGKKK